MSLSDWVRENAPDCGDNSCLFGGRRKGGMRTNGGCSCFRDVRPDMKRIFIERLWAAFTEKQAMKFGTVPHAWIGLHPTRRLDAEFWLRVLAVVQERGIRHDDSAAVRAVIKELDKVEPL